jgi:hypothetical protein
LITRNFDITVRIPEQGYIPVCFQVVQNDKSVYGLTIHLTDGINEINYSQVNSATITFAKADGYVVQGNLTVGAGTLTYTMGTNEIACPGSVMASIQLFGAAGERLTSARFRFDVVGDLVTPSAVQSTSQFPLLQQMLADIEQLKTDIVNLQVPNNSLLDTKLSDAAGQIKTRFTAHLVDIANIQSDYLFVYRATNLSISTGIDAVLPFDGMTSDSKAALLTDNGQSMTLQPGTYLISAKAAFGVNVNGYRQIKLSLANADLSPGWIVTTNIANAVTGGDVTTVSLNTILKVNTSQKMVLHIFQNSGTTLSILSSDQWSSLIISRIA